VDAMLGGGAANAQQRSWGSSAAVDDADVQGKGTGADQEEQASSGTRAELQVRFETKRAARQAADMKFEAAAAEGGELAQGDADAGRVGGTAAGGASLKKDGAWIGKLLKQSVQNGLGDI